MTDFDTQVLADRMQESEPSVIVWVTEVQDITFLMSPENEEAKENVKTQLESTKQDDVEALLKKYLLEDSITTATTLTKEREQWGQMKDTGMAMLREEMVQREAQWEAKMREEMVQQEAQWEAKLREEMAQWEAKLREELAQRDQKADEKADQLEQRYQKKDTEMATLRKDMEQLQGVLHQLTEKVMPLHIRFLLDDGREKICRMCGVKTWEELRAEASGGRFEANFELKKLIEDKIKKRADEHLLPMSQATVKSLSQGALDLIIEHNKLREWGNKAVHEATPEENQYTIGWGRIGSTDQSLLEEVHNFVNSDNIYPVKPENLSVLR